MGRASQNPRAKKAPKGVRLSVTFPVDTHAEIEEIAGKKSVSLAWVVRDAVNQYLDSQRPLFAKGRG